MYICTICHLCSNERLKFSILNIETGSGYKYFYSFHHCVLITFSVFSFFNIFLIYTHTISLYVTEFNIHNIFAINLCYSLDRIREKVILTSTHGSSDNFELKLKLIQRVKRSL